MQVFRNYMAVGGMPQAVSAYVDGKDFNAIDRVKRNIIRIYTKDLQYKDEIMFIPIYMTMCLV